MALRFCVLLLSATVFTAGCEPVSPPRAAREGDLVLVHYVGRLQDGEVFESTLDDGPRGLVIGEEKVLPALERALVGMSPGESRTLVIPSEKAFGPRRDEEGMVQTFQRSDLAHSLKDLKVGQVLNAAIFYPSDPQTPVQVPVRIVAVTPETVTVDANHPLAGEDLSFDLTLVEIIEEPPGTGD